MKRILAFLFVCASFALNAQGGGGVFQYSPIWTYTGSNIYYSNGAVGIGTANPTSSLHVIGTIATSTLDALSTGLVRGGVLQANGTNGLVIGGVLSGVNRIDNSSGTFRFLNSSDVLAPISLGSYSATGQSTVGADLYMTGGTRAIRGDAALELYSGGASNLNLRTSSAAANITTQFAGTPYLTQSTLGIAVTGSVSATGAIKTSSSTITSGGTATLQMPASSGTLANLADIIMHVDNYVTSSTLADATMYYFSHVPFGITTLNSKLKISGNWTIYQYQFEAWCNGVTSSAETSTLNYQIGTSTVTIRSDVTYSISGANTYTGTLNVSLNDGDLLNTQLITPNMATNPTNVGITMTYWLRRRQ